MGQAAFLAGLAVLVVSGAARAERPLVAVEGGVSSYTGALGERLEVGGAWGLRAGVAVRPGISVGLEYEGSANRIRGSGGDSVPLLVRNGANVYARWSPSSGLINPFVGAGLGYSWLRASTPVDGFQRDGAMHVPAEVGVMLRSGVVGAGLKVGYDVLIGSEAWSGGGGGLFKAGLTLGAQF